MNVELGFSFKDKKKKSFLEYSAEEDITLI